MSDEKNSYSKLEAGQAMKMFVLKLKLEVG